MKLQTILYFSKSILWKHFWFHAHVSKISWNQVKIEENLAKMYNRFWKKFHFRRQKIWPSVLPPEHLFTSLWVCHGFFRLYFLSFSCNLTSLNILVVIRSGLHRIAAAVAYMSVQVATYFPSLSCLSHLIRFVSVNFALGQFACLDTIKEISDRIFSAAAATPCYDRSRVNW